MKKKSGLEIVTERIEELSLMIRQGGEFTSDNALAEFVSRNNLIRNKELLKINLRIYKAMTGRKYNG